MPSVSASVAAHTTPCFAVPKSGTRARVHLTRPLAQILHRSVGIAAPPSRCSADPPLPSSITGHTEPSHKEVLFVGLLPLERSAILAATVWKRRRASVGIPCSRGTHGCRCGGSNGAAASSPTPAWLLSLQPRGASSTSAPNRSVVVPCRLLGHGNSLHSIRKRSLASKRLGHAAKCMGLRRRLRPTREAHGRAAQTVVLCVGSGCAE